MFSHLSSIRFIVIGCYLAALLACQPSTKPAGTTPVVEEDGETKRREMVESQLKGRDIANERVLKAMERVPRHEFVPPEYRSDAYGDSPLPIGHEQTISQPYIVAFMTEAARLQPEYRVLEVGTGSGYQAAVLAELVREVYTIELIPELAKQAEEKLKELGYKNIHVRSGDGYAGWPDAAPFDAIVVTCGAEHVPQPLVEQLKPGGRMIIPVGPMYDQSLNIIEKGPDNRIREHRAFPVRFVPLRRKSGSGNSGALRQDPVPARPAGESGWDSY